jgi:DNA-directed RNA polymerase specialized sigma subunit
MPTRQEQATDALDVARLVERAAGGDGQAWERLVDQYARLVSAIVEDFELGESDAADLAQVTGLRPLEHIQWVEHPDRGALSCFASRWQHLLHLLMANPSASPYTEISD